MRSQAQELATLLDLERAAARKADIETLVSIYAEDGVAAAPGRDFIRGREALKRHWAVPARTDVVSHQAVPQRVVVAGDFAYEWGHYSGATNANGEVRPFGGKYLIVWRRDTDGVWGMVQDMWNRVSN